MCTLLLAAPLLYRIPQFSHYCYDNTLRGLKAGNYLGSGIGIVFAVLGKRILNGKPGGFPARHEPFALSLRRARKE